MIIAFMDDYVVSSNPSGSQFVEIIKGLPEDWKIYVISKEIDKSISDKIRPIIVDDAENLSNELIRQKYISRLKEPRIDILHCNSLSHSLNSDVRISRRITTLHSAALGRIFSTLKNPLMYRGKDIKLHIIYNIGFTLRLWLYFIREITDIVKMRKLNVEFVSVSSGLAKELILYGLKTIKIINNSVESPNKALYETSKYGEVSQVVCEEPFTGSIMNEEQKKLPRYSYNSKVLCVSHGKWGAKGVFKLLKIVKDFDLNIEVNVVGHSRLSDLKQYANELGISDKLVMHGEIKDKNVIYSIAPTLVNLSWYESFGLVSAEANNWGLYVISSSTHGVKEWLKDSRNGIVCSSRSKEIATAISGATMGQKNTTIVCTDLYSANIMVSKYLEVYRSIV